MSRSLRLYRVRPPRSGVAEGADPIELDLKRPPGADRNRTGRGQHRLDQPARRRS